MSRHVAPDEGSPPRLEFRCVTHVNEACRTCGGIMSHISMSRGLRRIAAKSRERVMSHMLRIMFPENHYRTLFQM